MMEQQMVEYLNAVDQTEFIPWVFIILLIIINVINSLIPGIFRSLTQILQLQKLIRVNTELCPKTISLFTLTNIFMLLFIVGTISLYLSFVLAQFSAYPISSNLYWWVFIPMSTVIVFRFLLHFLLMHLFRKKLLLTNYVNTRVPIHFSVFMALLLICFIYYSIFGFFYFLLIGGGLLVLILYFNEFKVLQKLSKENDIKIFYIIIYLCTLRLLPWYGVFIVSVKPIL